MKLYKLTDKNGRTWNDTQWAPGTTHTATGTGTELCSDGFIHAYEHPLLAVLMNPIHGNFTNPVMWEADGEIVIRDGQLKCGCKSLTTVQAITMPEITTEQRVKFAILCAKAVCTESSFLVWADNWLNGSDRSEAARAARAAEAAEAAAWAARAAEAAAWAAWAARAAEAAEAAAWAARAAEAAEAAAWAARAAARATLIDFVSLAEQACQ